LTEPIQPGHAPPPRGGAASQPSFDATSGLYFDTPAQHIAYLEQALLRQKELLARAQKTLTAIHSSHGWKLLRAYYALREKVVPPGSCRRRVAKALFHWVAGACHAIPRWRSRGAVRPFHEGYARWITRREPRKAELAAQRRARFACEPLISIVVPTYNTPELYLEQMIQSVLEQTYGKWELCIADGGSSDPAVRKVLDRHRRHEPRIKVEYLSTNHGIAGNSNAAFVLASGDFVALLDHDDTLAPFALYEVVRTINEHPQADLLYSDEDKIDPSGSHRSEPHFKPDWAPDTLRSCNYIGHLAVYRRELLARIGFLRPGFDGSQDYDLLLRASEQAREIVHIPRVLYHWRIHDRSVAGDAGAKMYAYESGKKALTEHLRRQGIAGTVLYGPILGSYQVTYALPHNPLVSIIIPNRDHADLLARCLASLDRATYQSVEVLIVENDSRQAETFALYRQLEKRPKVRMLNWDRPFNFAAVNNVAATQAQGEVLLFLNNDVEAINCDWIERMLEHALRPEVGAVGAKLLYPNDTVQHGGVILGLRGTAGHSHTDFPREAPGYHLRLIVTQNLSAVTGACLMTRRAVFEEVNRFDERFIIAFNDLDLCLKMRQRGYRIVWTPYAELYHHESATRGNDFADPIALARYTGEEELFRVKWGDVLEAGDPYYNPNLTLEDGSFALRM
jgi:GT2 family glycosyltransferase